MNRAEIVRAALACEAMAKELRAALAADAAAEHAEHGTAPTWRIPGVTASVSTSNPSIAVVNEAAFVAWVAERHPSEVETVTTTRVRAAYRTHLLAGAVKRGAACAPDGEVIPGVEWRPGGDYRSLTLTPSRQVREALRQHARDIVAGRRPLALPEATSG